MFDSKIYCIGGTARSGKDTITQSFIKIFASKGILAKRYAFADELKKQLDPFLRMHLGISAFTEDAEEKSLIRPILLAWGKICRDTDENYWAKIVAEKIKNEPYPHVACISDYRYPNEHKFLGGETIHITRVKENGEPFPPVGADEEKHNPVLLESATHKFSWENYSDNLDSCYYKAQEFFAEVFSPEQITQWQNDFPIQTKI